MLGNFIWEDYIIKVLPMSERFGIFQQVIVLVHLAAVLTKFTISRQIVNKYFKAENTFVKPRSAKLPSKQGSWSNGL